MLDYFDKILCTNAPQNEVRWETTRITINSDKLEKVFVEHEDKWKSVNLTAKMLLEIACEYDRTLIIEDDILLKDGWQDKWKEAEPHIPEDWDMLYMGANLQRYSYEYNEHWVKIGGCWTGHCFGLNRKSAQYILDEFNKDEFVVGDALFMHLQQYQKINAYLINPMFAYQRPGWSDLQDKWVDYNGMMDSNFGKFLADEIWFTKTLIDKRHT
jgi:hypothetical protein